MIANSGHSVVGSPVNRSLFCCSSLLHKQRGALPWLPFFNFLPVLTASYCRQPRRQQNSSVARHIRTLVRLPHTTERLTSMRPLRSYAPLDILVDLGQSAWHNRFSLTSFGHTNRCATVVRCPECGTAMPMKSRNKELWDKAADERRRCRDWLLNGQPKLLTKAELQEVALRELNVSKSSFDFGWIDAIERTGRHDWYEPLPRRSRPKS